MALAVALVIGVPVLVRAWPVRVPDLSTATVLSRVRASSDAGYSGTVETVGTLGLPVTSRFTDVGSLLGGRTTLRVWWRDPQHWRVDKVLVAGETDLFHNGAETTEWRYEAAEATRSVDPVVRLPRTADLIPPALAARALDGVRTDDVERLRARRIAGVSAVGLRIRPSAVQASIDHADLWADPATGIVLRLDLYAAGDGSPSFSTAFTSFSARRPALETTRFDTPAGLPVRIENVLDIADAANQFAPVVPPDVVAGLRRSTSEAGAVGIYGTGLTRILVIPLRGGDADTLRRQVERSPGSTSTTIGPSLMAGPLGVLVTDSAERGGRGAGAWLVVGAVTRATLVAAGQDLLAGSTFR